MKCDKNTLLLYAVTAQVRPNVPSLPQQVEQALMGGCTCVQLREKSLPDEALLPVARELARLCRRYEAPFLVNDRVELALRCGADGVHVGQSDLAAATVRQLLGPDKLLGVSAHTVAEAQSAQAAGADYLGVGALFPTATKPDAQLVGLDTLRAICRAVDLPVVGIGGITQENLPQLSHTGLTGVALVSDLFSAPDIPSRCQQLRRQAETLFPAK